MKPFYLIEDRNHQPTSTPLASDYVENVVLVANVEQTVTVPTAAKDGFVVFGTNGEFWAKPNATAAIPAVTTSDGSGSVLNPGSFSLYGVTTVHLIAPSACKLSLSFYAR